MKEPRILRAARAARAPSASYSTACPLRAAVYGVARSALSGMQNTVRLNPEDTARSIASIEQAARSTAKRRG